MRYISLVTMLLFVLCKSFAQSNNAEYNNLLKSSKKTNNPHIKINLGLGISTLDNFPVKSSSVFFYQPPVQVLDSSYSNTTMGQFNAAIDFDIIETKKVYFNIGGFYTYGYWPNKKANYTPDYLSNFDLPAIEDEKGSDKLNSYEANIKLGLGGASYKFYVVGGIGTYDFKSTLYMKSSIIDNTNTAVSYESTDTGYLKLDYTKLGIGMRIGDNLKKYIFDFNVYKLLPRGDFFQSTEKPSFSNMVVGFGKYSDNYPSLPIGMTMALSRRGKYEVKIDFRKIRDKDYTDKNANYFSIIIAKQFDIYDKNKK